MKRPERGLGRGQRLVGKVVRGGLLKGPGAGWGRAQRRAVKGQMWAVKLVNAGLGKGPEVGWRSSQIQILESVRCGVGQGAKGRLGMGQRQFGEGAKG